MMSTGRGANSKLGDYVFHTKYGRSFEKDGAFRFETFPDMVSRVLGMHRRRFAHLPEVLAELDAIEPLFLKKQILPSGRIMQFGGMAIEKNEIKGYNCSYLPVNYVDSFAETFYLLLCGTGVGFSVRAVHTTQLPVVSFSQDKEIFVVPDTIEGWAEAVRALTHAAFGQRPVPVFDYSQIRPKGSRLVSSGGLAPGPAPLKEALVELEAIFRNAEGRKLSSVDILDCITTLSYAVLSGGIRRSSLICLFDPTDTEMINAKSGNWYETHPKRSTCNNSAVFGPEDKQEVAQFVKDYPSIFEFGEPGIIVKNSTEYGTNPCGEAGLREFSFCNLSDVILPGLSESEFMRAVRAAAFLGTLYATYTNFKFLNPKWRQNTEEDALIGVSLNGIASSDVQLYDIEAAAKAVIAENAHWARILGINPAARTTLVKPGGTTSLIVDVPAGIHPSHAPYYVRRVVEPANTPVAKYFIDNFPSMVEKHIYNPANIVILFPCAAGPNATTRYEPVEKMLARIEDIQRRWVLAGRTRGPDNHNVSATVNFTKSDLPVVAEWLKKHLGLTFGVSFIQHDPSIAYQQAPFTEIDQAEYDRLWAVAQNVDFSKIGATYDFTTPQVVCTSDKCELLAMTQEIAIQ